MKYLIYIIITVTLLGWLAFSKDSICLDEAKVNQLLKLGDFEFQNLDMSTVQTALCSPEDKRYQLLDILMFLYYTDTSDTAGPVNVNGHQLNIIGTSPYTFFKERVKKIIYDESKDSYCAREDVSSFGYSNYGSEIYLCPFFFSADLAKVTRAAAILHEARHSEGFHHVTCQSGDKAGAHDSCDSSLEFNGSYAVALEYLLRLYNSKTTNLSEQDKVDLRFYIMNNTNDNFNEQIIPIVQGITAVKSNGQFIFYDGKKFRTIYQKENDYITSYEHLSRGPIVINKNVTKGFLGGLTPIPFPKHTALGSNFLDMTSLMSITMDSMTSCKLYTDLLSCYSSDDNKIYSSKLKISDVSYLFTADRDQSYMPFGMYMGTKEGQLYRIPDNINGLTEDYKFRASFYENIRGVVNLNEDFDIVLTGQEGELFNYHKTNKYGQKGSLEAFSLKDKGFEKVFHHRYSQMVDAH